MRVDEIKNVAFIGSGTMGSFNSMVAAIAGYDVTVYDISEDALKNLPQRHAEWGEILMEKWGIDSASVKAALTRTHHTADPAEAVKRADLISESVFERLDLKRQTHARFEGLCRPNAIITTNTSTLLVSDIASAVKDKTRFAAMHYHQPSVLVDLAAGPETSEKTMDILKRYVKSCNMTYVVLKKEKGGYLHNTMFSALLFSGMGLAAIGMDFKEVDRSWRINQKTDVGPFGMLDHVGLNVPLDIIEDEGNKSGPQVEKQAVIRLLRERVDRGDLGMKTGRGFYSYPDPEFSRPEFIDQGLENRDASRFMLNIVLASAVSLVAGGYGDVRDVDLSWMLTHNPEIGPFGMIDKKGLDVMLSEIKELPILDESKAQERDEAIAFLKSYVDRGDLGVKTGKGFYTYPDPTFSRNDFLIND
jgi:enoyl-CoA hydratase / 3-hydroxyacyl-CoA dehydrogenase